MTYAWKEVHPDTRIFNIAWMIDAPWAHPMWNQYVLLMYDLTSDAPTAVKPKIVLEGATHEFFLFAINPEFPVEKDAPIWQQHDGKFNVLQPANYGYQFKAESNEAATARIQQIIDKIVVMELSPDTDFRSYWDTILPDMKSLHRTIFDKVK